MTTFAVPAALGLAWALLIAAAPGDNAGSSTGEIVATPAMIRDFMIQNVCLDARGAVLAAVSPADDNPALDDTGAEQPLDPALKRAPLESGAAFEALVKAAKDREAGIE